MLTSGLVRTHLVADGVDQINGKSHTPISKVPVWAYIFVILDLTMCLGGGAVRLPICSASSAAPPLR